MTESASGDVSFGISSAIDRLRRHDLAANFREEDVASALDALGELPVPQRAAELFIELTVVASAARQQYNDVDLTLEDMRHYRDVSRNFLNSFWHE